MSKDLVLFVEKDVCGGNAWTLKWGTLILYDKGLIFYYNRKRRDNPELHEAFDLDEIEYMIVKKMDWLVQRLFWIGRKQVNVKTPRSTNRFYLRNTDTLLKAVKELKPTINLVDEYR